MKYERKTSDIFISDQLREVLSKFEGKSSVAALLLKTRHPKEILVDNHVNYISISKSDPSKISYLTVDRMSQIDPSEYWTSSRRFIAKPGSFISKIFKDIPNKDVEIFSNFFKLQIEQDDIKFRIISGEEIKKWYYYESYQSQNSSLGSSCMKHSSCQDYLKIYVDNPDICKMLILTDLKDKLVGRALLWEVDGHKIMDRIYTVNDDRYQHQFKKWGDDNGWWYKAEQRWNNCLWFECSGKKEVKRISFDLPNFEEGCLFPYMDTFKFINIKKGKLFNDIPKSNRNMRTLIASDGDFCDWNALAKDDLTQIYHHRGEIVYLKYLDKNVFCGNTKYSETNDASILNEHAIWMEQARDWIFNEDFNHLNNSNEIEKRIEIIQSNKTKIKSRLFDFSFSLDSI